jgi:hypothetical protein
MDVGDHGMSVGNITLYLRNYGAASHNIAANVGDDRLLASR